VHELSLGAWSPKEKRGRPVLLLSPASSVTCQCMIELDLLYICDELSFSFDETR
jgi:hypothetical protein